MATELSSCRSDLRKSLRERGLDGSSSSVVHGVSGGPGESVFPGRGASWPGIRGRVSALLHGGDNFMMNLNKIEKHRHTTHTPTHTHTHAHTPTHTHPQTPAHTDTPTRTHAHTPAPHTHPTPPHNPHTHTEKGPSPSLFVWCCLPLPPYGGAAVLPVDFWEGHMKELRFKWKFRLARRVRQINPKSLALPSPSPPPPPLPSPSPPASLHPRVRAATITITGSGWGSFVPVSVTFVKGLALYCRTSCGRELRSTSLSRSVCGGARRGCGGTGEAMMC